MSLVTLRNAVPLQHLYFCYTSVLQLEVLS